MEMDLATVDTLHLIGKTLVRDYVANAVQFIFYGMYLVFIRFSISIILRRGKDARSIALVATLVVMFLISTFLWVQSTLVLVQRIHTTLIDESTLSLDARLKLAGLKPQKLLYAADSLFLANCLIGDLLVTWRVYVINSKARYIVALFGTTLLGILGADVAYVVCFVRARLPVAAETPETCRNLMFGSLVASAGLNTFATLLLVRLAWLHRRMTKKTQLGKTVVYKILTVLALSALVYAVFFMFAILAPRYLKSSPLPSTMGDIGEQAFYQLTGLYPNAVIVLTTHDTSFFGLRSSSSSSRRPFSATLGSMAFRSPDLEQSGRIGDRKSSVSLAAPSISAGRPLSTDNAMELPPRRPEVSWRASGV
ncbi:hypothetical protein EXIGLDRAFT_839453 [Exidia glandulosa HHB12029]|uniref:G-protein coupled receptors family 1 profile domain-containing protein n=1 Tax=Exidia glandulosa HHB12029 TaxID=1314781 RepID=A0A165F0R2_EXIGL|nr:hypothetical protein EXIGLDRAFT_839453 [Exidia glandulosa HHB12029]